MAKASLAVCILLALSSQILAEHLIQALPLAPAASQRKRRVGRLETIPGTCCSPLLILPAATLCWKTLMKHSRRGEVRYRASEMPLWMYSGVISVLNHRIIF